MNPLLATTNEHNKKHKKGKHDTLMTIDTETRSPSICLREK